MGAWAWAWVCWGYAGLHTSIRNKFGPGGRSALGAVGGLGAFMYGDADDEAEPEPEPAPVPRHQRLQVVAPHARKHTRAT